jgi:hypothetical protein
VPTMISARDAATAPFSVSSSWRQSSMMGSRGTRSLSPAPRSASPLPPTSTGEATPFHWQMGSNPRFGLAVSLARSWRDQGSGTTWDGDSSFVEGSRSFSPVVENVV